MISRKQLYAAGMPFGDSSTRLCAGRLIYGGGGGGGESTTSPQLAPELRPLADLYTQQATQLASTPWQAYTGQRNADLNATQNSALDMVTQRATNGSPVMDQANSTLTSALQGGQTNPYLDSLVKKAQSSVVDSWNNTTKPALDTAQINSGSFGNSGLQQRQQIEQQKAAQQMSDIATQMYGNAYTTDRANQMQALQLAPTYGNQAYTDAAQLLNAGNTKQNADQSNLDFAYQQFQDQQNDPYKKLQAIGGVLGQSMGSKTTQSGGGK